MKNLYQVTFTRWNSYEQRYRTETRYLRSDNVFAAIKLARLLFGEDIELVNADLIPA